MKKVLFVGFVLAVGAFTFVTSPLVTEVSARTAPSVAFCQMLENIISAGMLKDDKIQSARLAAGCLEPVATSTVGTIDLDITSADLSLEYVDGEEGVLWARISVVVDNTTDQDFYVYGDSVGVNFLDQEDRGVYPSSQRIGLVPPVNVDTVVDDANTQAYVVRAGGKVQFIASGSVKANQLFAGEYSASLARLHGNTTLYDVNRYNMTIPQNMTNKVIVIGEKSPYLNKASFVKKITDGFSGVIVEGARLSTAQSAEINCSKTGSVSNKPYYTSPAEDTSTASFVIVDPVKNNDTCWISVFDSEYGASNSVDFKTKGSENRPPVIHGVSAPTLLRVGEMGTWTVKASDPENGQLSYSVDWGDVANSRSVEKNTTTARRPVTSEIRFTHSYSKPGNFTINFSVLDDFGQPTYSSVTIKVQVGGNDDPLEIAPVSYTLPGKTVVAGATQEFVLEKTVDIKSLVVNWTDNKTDCQAQVSVGNTNSGWKDVSSPGNLSLANIGNANRISISAKNVGAKCSGVVVTSIGVSGLAEVALRQNIDRDVSGTASAFVAWESIVKLIQALK